MSLPTARLSPSLGFEPVSASKLIFLLGLVIFVTLSQVRLPSPVAMGEGLGMRVLSGDRDASDQLATSMICNH
jgi:hypothetical protein